MKRIHYAGDSELTGSAIADAIVLYAEALAGKGAAAAVDVPVYRPGGTVDLVRFLVGPASQMVAVPEISDLPELMDEVLVSELARRTRELCSNAAVVETENASVRAFDDMDDPDF